MTWKGRRLWVIAIVVVLVLGLGSLVAYAQTKPQDQIASAQEKQDLNSIEGTAFADTQEGDKNHDAGEAEEIGESDEANEKEESTALASQAKITTDQAKEAALAAVPGTVNKIELDNENGYLVYSVEIGDKEVKVDANTGKVLKIDADNDTGEQQEDDSQNIED